MYPETKTQQPTRLTADQFLLQETRLCSSTSLYVRQLARNIISTPRPHQPIPPVNQGLNKSKYQSSTLPNRCIHLFYRLQIHDHPAPPMTYSEYQTILILETCRHQELLDSRVYAFRPHRLSPPLRLHRNYAAAVILHPFVYGSFNKGLAFLILPSCHCHLSSPLSTTQFTNVCRIDISPVTYMCIFFNYLT